MPADVTFAPPSLVHGFFGNYVVGSMISYGGFSKVFLCCNLDVGCGATLVVKRMPNCEFDKRNVIRETEIQRNLHHANIAKMVEVVRTEGFTFIVFERFGRDVADRVIQDGPFDEISAKRALRQIVSAVKYIHGQGIIHRDVKAENVLVSDSTTNGALPAVKLTDFGLAVLTAEKNPKRFDAVGSFEYVSPEVLSGGGYWKEVDMWGVGTIAYVMLSSFFPFGHHETIGTEQVREAILTLNYTWDEVVPPPSCIARDFVAKCLVLNPSERMSTDEAQKHPFLLTEDD
jgi:serine/threonine protein kinase